MLAALLAGAAAGLAVSGIGLVAAGGAKGGEPLLPRLLARAGAGMQAAPPPDLEARIAAAGRPAGLGPRELMAAKLGAAVAGAAAAVPVAAAAPARIAALALLGGPVAGFLAPDLWLARRTHERARRMRRELPALLELLRVTVASGSSLADALGRVGASSNGPLAAEWRTVGRQVGLGVPLDRALEALERSAPLPEVHALAAAFDRARRHGAPIADTLSAQARDARFALARHAREEAARAGPKIQLVVALLLVPSVLLMVAAALLAALLGAGPKALPGTF
ncbi:MAG TPA: type II secretion system F family protein [Thermoleophilaceae bacterium]|nr:type II secretion system F family protein [Thermoleophilaceae bacterium]